MLDQREMKVLLNNQQAKWERISRAMERVPQEPMLLITDVFRDGDLFLAERLMQEGESVLLEAQAYWMTYLIPALTNYFGAKEVTIRYDATVPLAPVEFWMNEQLVARLSPYHRQFEEVGMPGYKAIQQDLKEIDELLQREEAEIQRWVTLEENPKLYGEDDLWLFARASLQPAKFKKHAQEQIMQHQQTMANLQQRQQSLYLQLDMMKRDYLEVSYHVERIKQRVERWGLFKFYAPNNEGES